jgi:RNA polymerase sigma-70 factor (ECF subfamily)
MIVTSRSLLERLQDRGDAWAWQRLLTAYEPWLRGWLSRAALQPADADDVLQDVLVVVSQKLPEFVHNGRAGAFRTWLRSILTNRVRHFLRTRQNRQALGTPQPLNDWLDQLADPDSALSREWDAEHDRHVARRVLATIQGEFNAQTWEVFRLLVLEEVPAAEVARRLGITPNAVYVAKARVLARLRAELRGLADD